MIINTNYLNLKQVARELDVSIITIRRYIKSGKLRAKKIGRDYRVSEEELVKFAGSTDQLIKEITPQKIDTRSPEVEQQSQRGKEGHRNGVIIPGINSHVMEAIVEMSQNVNSINEIREIISEHALECLDLLKRIERDGIVEPQTAITLLLIDEAIKNLQIRRNLFMRLMNGEGIILLPLPPHLCDSLLAVTAHEMIFSSDNNLPPHLKHSHYSNLAYVGINELIDRTKNAKIVVLEGYFDNNNIFIRESAANIVYNLCFSGLREIFIHDIPQIPPHTTFVELPSLRDDIKILKI